MIIPGVQHPAGADCCVILDDHKTSSRKWDQKKHTVRKTAQVATYLDAYEQLSGVRPATFSFSIMKRDGQFERRYVNPSDAELSAFYLKRDLIVRQLSSGDDLPPNTTSNLCSSKYCSWWNQCPFGAAMEGPHDRTQQRERCSACCHCGIRRRVRGP
jgi:hypothetical protein